MKKFYLLLISFVYININTAQGIYQLWGTAGGGGTDDQGAFYCARQDGSFVLNRPFEATNPGVASDGNGLTVYNGKFYTVTYEGGVDDRGIIAVYDPATNSYSKKADIHGILGYNAYCRLTVFNNKLYGTTGGGGNNYDGTLFEFDPATNVVTKKHDFNAATTGSLPWSELTVYNNKLYGTTLTGGASDHGVVYEYDPATGILTKKRDFNVATTGKSMRGNLLVYNNKLWGFNSESTGASAGGYIFSYDPATNTLSGKVELGTIGGKFGSGTMAVLNNKFYAEIPGGTNNKGLIFQYDPATNVLTKEYDLVAANPNGARQLVVYNSLLYGSGSYNGAFVVYGGIYTFNPATNAFSTKVNFNEENGGRSTGLLTMYNNKMYQLSYGGGIWGRGGIEEFDPANNNYTTKISLGTSGLYYPVGSLSYYNNKIYGMAAGGGDNRGGGIFEYDIATKTFTIKVHMQYSTGEFEDQGGLTLYNNKFYGVTADGGSNYMGTIFDWDPATNVYTVRHNFGATSGSGPHGSLLLYNGKFYGTTRNGGSLNKGTLFEFNPATNIHTLKANFDGTRGSAPLAGLTLAGNRIFGVASEGGANDQGTLFEYLPQANGLIKKFDFNIATTGSSPQSNMVVYNNKLYGFTALGAGLDGYLFEYDIAADNLTTKLGMTEATGQYVLAGLSQQGNKLYGVANVGGENGYGTIFSYDPATNKQARLHSFDVVTAKYPRRSNPVITPAPVAPGSPNACINASPAIVTNENKNEWIQFTDGEGRAVAELNPNGNMLGRIDVKFYVNNGPIRQKGGFAYLDRNITIAVQNQPATPVSIRLYVRKTEYDALKNTAGAGVTTPADIILFKNNDQCSPLFTDFATAQQTAYTSWGQDYIFTTDVTSFSSFYFASYLAPLPVQVLSFNGVVAANGNQLNWKASCTGITSFTIERSMDGSSFSAIGSIQATQQDCDAPFRFTDTKPAAKTWYRLQMKEANGIIKYSNIIVLSRDVKNALQVNIFPNPVVNGQAAMQVVSARQTTLQIKLADAAGRVLLQKAIPVQAGTNSMQLPLYEYAAGVYHLYCTDGEQTHTVRFIKK